MPAAVRLPRTVAVRRALLAGLFLVGFVALGFAFGPGAHADDRSALTGTVVPVDAANPSSAPAASQDRAESRGAATTPGAEAPAAATAPARAATRAESPALHRSTADLSQQGEDVGSELIGRREAATDALTEAVRPAAEQAAPITDPVTGAVREIGDAADAALPLPLPSGERPDRPGDGAQPPHPHAPHGEGPSGTPTGPGTHGSHGPAAAAPAHGSDGAVLPDSERGTSHSDDEQGAQGRQGLPGPYPKGPQAPSQNAGDGHGPRGDQHAAVPADITHTGLLPGGVRTADGAPTRHRAEDILEFPG